MVNAAVIQTSIVKIKIGDQSTGKVIGGVVNGRGIMDNPLFTGAEGNSG
jgi:hypothetical protein